MTRPRGECQAASPQALSSAAGCAPSAGSPRLPLVTSPPATALHRGLPLGTSLAAVTPLDRGRPREVRGEGKGIVGCQPQAAPAPRGRVSEVCAFVVPPPLLCQVALVSSLCQCVISFYAPSALPFFFPPKDKLAVTAQGNLTELSRTGYALQADEMLQNTTAYYAFLCPPLKGLFSQPVSSCL